MNTLSKQEVAIFKRILFNTELDSTIEHFEVIVKYKKKFSKIIINIRIPWSFKYLKIQKT